MGYYILGVVIAFLINVVRLFITIITGFSQRIKNIEKLGVHYNITEGKCTKQKPTPGKVVFYITDVLVITPLLSWIYVCYFLFTIVKARINKAPVPEKLKEINYKLSSIDLPREIVKGCMNEIVRFYGGEDADFDHRNPYDDEYDKNTYVITSGSGTRDWNIHLELDKKNHTFAINACDPDFGEHIDTYEYKFEGTELWTHTIEAKHKYPDHTEYDIKNGVVMEQNYRNRQKDALFSSPEKVEEKVQKLYSEIDWEKNPNPAFAYFILFRHRDLFDDATTKRFLQSEYERLTYGFKRLEERVDKLGCSICKQELISGNTIHCDKCDIPEESLVEIREILHGGGMVRYGVSYAEFSLYERLTEDLKLYLSRL
jgi:hypothetical protein